MSVAYIIADYLQDQGLGTIGGFDPWSIFVGTEPASPDEAVTIYDTGGPPGNPDGPLFNPTIQVRVRSHDYLAGYNRAVVIRDILILPTSRIMGDWRCTGVWLASDVTKIGQDDNNRNLFTANYRLMMEPLNS